ncbi:MAG: LysR family transcriptional regulator [Clostridia bacterium]|nr:LysR family transcriptional regulator [Clostridia bacterium]MBQ4619370.1 LysR family transcriptional regulator [Clostridia bacterium]MBQ9855811.1 LysR family transcriptional regulator [Clostridia bacterium]
MNLNQLRYFVSVAESQSFTKAAINHYISQTAITQQIHALEENIGAKLFDRNSRPVSLTPAGKVFLKEAREILGRVEGALQKTRDASTGLEGEMRLGYTKGYEHSDLPKYLRSFHQEYPNVLISCYRLDTDQLATGLLAGEYDVIFTWDSTNLRKEDKIQLKVVEHVPLRVALYANHPLARKKELTRKDLKQESILFMSPSGTGDSFGDAYYIRLYQEAGYHPNILLRSNDMESILMMVAAEEGISIVPEYTHPWDVGTENVVFVPLSGEGETEEILIAWRKNDENPALKRFIQTLPEG